ncbi:sporulation protein [Paractinoplanes lichenicola]|uniref:Sporulation protein n=1 Tax=Paractinoplanes lichenicola TaxID=2802976 RepID=A0ABS1VGB1_9ACTN|nr:sporulation protein [Actinoplanes lichenicola]MBL7253655.1 sporulation protein [Actinoplanes lichenicola]
MVFKKMMRAFGVGGPTVDTVLANPNTRPGLALEGQVRIAGGDHDVTIEGIVLGLVTRVESEHGENLIEFHRLPVAGAFQLRKGENRDLPFSFPMPWETPITDVYGQRLHGMTMGLRTELSVAKAVDKGDLDHVSVHPLPSQERILDAFARLGFRFKNADLEHGAIYGVRMTLPFYQEIEFYPPPQYAGAINEVEVTFIADPEGVEVVLEFDKRGGFLQPGHDAYGRFRVSHADADTTDWAAVVEQWVSEAAGRYQGLRSAGGFGHGAPGYGGPGYGGHGAPGYGAPGYGAPGYGAPGYGHGGGYGHHGHYAGHGGHGRGGMGMGAMAAGVAGGVVGGMILGEVMDEAFEGDDDGGGDEE